MDIPPIDAFIPAHPKDYSKLPYVLEGLRQFVPDIRQIFICAPTPMPREVAVTAVNFIWCLDETVLPWDRSKCPHRPNWVFQQMLKLFQDVTSNWYLVTDADIIVNQPLHLWSRKKNLPILYLGRDQKHPPYFTFNQAVLGYGMVYPHSFLSEFTLYSKNYINAMVAEMGKNNDTVWEHFCSIINADCYPAESELYGSYIAKKLPDAYLIRHLKTCLSGHYGNHIWSREEIEKTLERYRKMDNYQLISLHSWE